MKKVLFFILSIIYLTTSTGANLHYHYCMGTLADWSIWVKHEEKKCSKCGMEKKDGADNGCCKDEHKWLKIEDDQKANFFIESPALSPTEINHIDRYSFTWLSIDILHLLPLSNAPPRKGDIDVFILNSNFRI